MVSLVEGNDEDVPRLTAGEMILPQVLCAEAVGGWAEVEDGNAAEEVVGEGVGTTFEGRDDVLCRRPGPWRAGLLTAVGGWLMGGRKAARTTTTTVHCRRVSVGGKRCRPY